MATVLEVSRGLKRSAGGWCPKKKGALGRRECPKSFFGQKSTLEVEQFFGQKIHDFFLAGDAAQKGVFRKSDGRRWALEKGHESSFVKKTRF